MNEFRQFLGLKREPFACRVNNFRVLFNLAEFESFQEWNPDPEIAACQQSFHTS